MINTGLLAELEQVDATGRRRLLRHFPGTHDPAALGVIARSLADPSASVCEAAVETLARCGGRAAAEAAVLHLHSDDPTQRGYAAEALVRLGLDAIPTITTLLTDPDHDVRKYAAEALASVGDSSALTGLVTLLQDQDATVASAAAEALGLLRLPDAIPALAKAARDGADWVRAAAIYALGEIGGRIALEHICATPQAASFPVLAMAAEAAGRAASADPRLALTFLAGLLTRDEPGLTELVLGVLGPVLDVQPAVSVPEQLQPTIAQAAQFGLRSADPQVRAASARCCGVVPGLAASEDITLLRELLASDGQLPVRLAALGALVSRGQVPSSMLAGLAANSDENTDVRVAALRLFASHVEPISVDIERQLVQMVAAAERPQVRTAALRLLLQVESAEALRLGLDVLDDEGVQDDESAVAELSACSVQTRLALVRTALVDATPETRRWAFSTLLPIRSAGDVRSVHDGPDVLMSAAHDNDWSVRAHALRLLHGEPAGWARQICRRACADPDERVRVRAVEALASVPSEAGDDELLRAGLVDSVGWVRVAALAGLTALGRVDQTLLEPALRDDFPVMRRTALQAARQIVDDSLPALRQQIAQAASVAALDGDPELARLGRELTWRLE